MVALVLGVSFAFFMAGTKAFALISWTALGRSSPTLTDECLSAYVATFPDFISVCTTGKADDYRADFASPM